MRRTGMGLSLASATLLGLAGCWTTDRPPKPRPNPEEFILPPEGEARFSQPPTFPQKSMNEGMLRKDKEKDDGQQPGSFRPPGRTGGGPGGY